MDKKLLIKAIGEGNCVMMSHSAWRYPVAGDDQRKCPMLDFMFKVEQQGGGTIVFVHGIIETPAIIKAIESDKKVLIEQDDRWQYPQSLGTENDNKLYRVMMEVHGWRGVLIFVPNPRVTQKLAPLSHREVFGKNRDKIHEGTGNES